MKKISFITISSILLFFIADVILSTILNRGIDKYFGLNSNAQVLMIGHSQLMLAVDKSSFEKETSMKVAKYCREGVNVADRQQMIRQYLMLPCADSLQYVIYGVDQFLFNTQDLSKNSYKLFYPFMDNDSIDAYIRQSSDYKDYWIHKIIRTSRYTDSLLNSSIRGWFCNWDNYKFGQADTTALVRLFDNGNLRRINTAEKEKQLFENSLSMLTQRNIKVILVQTPVIGPLNRFEPDKYKLLHDYFIRLAKSSDLIEYWDLNPQFEYNYPLFYDYIHLNDKGQEAVSHELAQRFNKLFGK